jgi:hypothetical protein
MQRALKTLPAKKNTSCAPPPIAHPFDVITGLPSNDTSVSTGPHALSCS